MMKKTLIISLIILCFIIISYFCYSFLFKSDKGKLYNDTVKISQDGDNYSYLSRVGSTDESTAKIDFNAFSGFETIWIIDFKEQTEVKFNYTSEISKGKFKGVLISPAKEVTTIFENNSNGGHSFVGPKGKYLFKLVGDNTKGNVEVELHIGEDATVLVAEK